MSPAPTHFDTQLPLVAEVKIETDGSDEDNEDDDDDIDDDDEKGDDDDGDEEDDDGDDEEDDDVITRLREGRLHALHEEPQVLRHRPHQLQTGCVRHLATGELTGNHSCFFVNKEHTHTHTVSQIH